MDYSELKNFKLRYFILFGIGIFIASFILLFLIDIPASEEWVTFFVSVSCFMYLLHQTKKWNFSFNEQPIHTTMTKGRWAKYLSITASFQLITVVFTTILFTIVYLIFEEHIRELFSFFPMLNLDEVQSSFLVYVLFFINICILAPIYEEMLFRGILLRRFTLRWSPQKSIIISSLIFGVIHLNPINVVFAFALGCVLGYAYLKTKNIVIPMLLHSFNNFLAYLQFVYTNQTTKLDLPTTEAAQQELMINVAFFFILAAFIIFLLVKYYKNFCQLKNPAPIMEEQTDKEMI
ncbi:type II CAAX endopeptidase family protein [Solibacillus sp. FSL W7-1472]|uniref:CPBP family intramembrane glutamic endopeptidase n=1 Tax=Solibacillus sp. FSL W7-1472 TaxID=2921707 RepID=UPI0030D99A9C